MVLFMFFEALYFGHVLSFYTMQLEPPKTVFEFNTDGIYRGNRGGDFRQLVVSILPHSSWFQIVIMGFTPCNCD